MLLREANTLVTSLGSFCECFSRISFSSKRNVPFNPEGIRILVFPPHHHTIALNSCRCSKTNSVPAICWTLAHVTIHGGGLPECETAVSTIMAVETFDVCKICYNASSHKTNPTLTLTAKVDSDDTRSCPACRQEWSTQTVAKDPDTRKWVAIRPLPKIDPKIDYHLCQKQPCQKGPLGCTYAHSRVELILWKKTRLQQPRPAPLLAGPYHQFQRCWNVRDSTNGVCPYGQHCTFAHSEEELERWINEQVGAYVLCGVTQPCYFLP